jgi:glycosyltransferase involved in cell wall biosynthesis
MGHALPALKYRCYRKSFGGTLAHSAMTELHRSIGTWAKRVDRFIALSVFMKSKLVEGGIPESKISVKGNTLQADPGVGDGAGGYLLFVGRLSEEKGIASLCRAWHDRPEMPPLVMVGDGPMRGVVRELCENNENVRWLGAVESERVTGLMKRARFLLAPSVWYEGFPKVVVEAYATGLPILASRIGSLGELVQEGQTGWLFMPGDVRDIRRVILKTNALREEYPAMRDATRRAYEEHYSPPANKAALLRVYSEAMGRAIQA